MDQNEIILSVFFGIIGLAYFSYGKKQSMYFLCSGLCLMLFPYFISGTTWILIIGIALIVLPFVLTKFVER